MNNALRSANPAPGPTLVCFALEQEAGALRQLLAARPDVSILVTGIGHANAERGVREFLQQNSPRRVFTCGFAGGLDPALTVGTVVFQTMDPTLSEQLRHRGARAATFHCATRVATTAVEKAELRRTTGRDAVEMESAAIHAVCAAHEIPCTTVRVISDTATEDLPLDFNQLANPDQSLNFGKLAWAIAKAPGKIPALLRLQKNTNRAAKRLADALAGVL